MRPARLLATLLVVGALGASTVPSAAVDRSLGAGVSKPALGGQPWSADAKARLSRDIDTLLRDAPTLHGAHVGLLAIDTGTGDVLYARNADDVFVPGSTLKLLTGSMALSTLGAGYRFVTQAYLGPNQTLYIKAGGDPLLTGADVAALAHAAVATGAWQAPYAIAIDAGGFDFAPYPAGWSEDDFVYDYAPKLTPVPVDENALQLNVAPGRNVGDALVVRESEFATYGDARLALERCAQGEVATTAPPAATAKRSTEVTLDVVRYAPSGCFDFVGSLPTGGERQAIGVALREPARYLYGLIYTSAGVQPSPAISAMSTAALYRTSPVPAGARLIWTQSGEALSDLLADMWLPSDNLVAEMLLRTIGLHAGGVPGTTEHGAAAERTWLRSIGIDPATVTLTDGSGLSSYDRITPRALVAILQADWSGPYRDIVIDDLPIAGIRGTLAQSFIGTLAERRTFAKTGTVNHARGLAGYLATLHHGALTFAFSIDDWMGADSDVRLLRARVLARFIGD